MPGHSHEGELPDLTPEEQEIARRLRAHVGRLAGEIGERNMKRFEALQASADYIESMFKQIGLPVASHDYIVDKRTVRNLSAELPGESRPEEIIIIGAHYDSITGSPGANDNGTGVAGMLEIARLLVGQKPARTIRFVAFANEEPPYFHTHQMGSLVYARRCRELEENIVGMLCLETIGCYKDEPKTQRHPFPLGLFYPDRGNFIGFIGNMISADLIRTSVGSFREHTRFPSQGLAVLNISMMGIDWSDHWSFWEVGYPAVMITDTALYRYEHYHTAEDTPDKIDYDRAARVVAGLARVTLHLANREPPVPKTPHST